MRKQNFKTLAEYFCNLEMSSVDEASIHQIKRSMLDFLGCSAFAASHGVSGKFTDFILQMGEGGKTSSIWGMEERYSPQIAGFVNAVRTSNIEYDDCSNIGAGVHPAIYVYPAALASWEEEAVDQETFMRAILFGYEMSLRMGLRAVEKLRELGFHGPGMIGGLAATASAGIVNKLSVEEMTNALAITASLLPLSPFIGFIEGADTKDFYGGWGVFIALHAVKAAKSGLTGPESILEGPSSLESIFAGEAGDNVKPGEPFYINEISFKEFPACHATHPALTVIFNLRKTHDIDTDQIKSITLKSYPFSVELNAGIGEVLTEASSRLSLAYTAAYALIEGEVEPDAFFADRLKYEKYDLLRKKVIIKTHTEYGTGPFGKRGCIVEIVMNDGSVIKGDTDEPNWSEAPNDDQLIAKFMKNTAAAMSREEQKTLLDYVMNLENMKDISLIINMMRNINIVS